MRIFHNLNVDFLGKRKIAYTFSISLLLLGLISLVVRGLEFGIDFRGGTEIVVDFQKPVNISTVRGYIEQIGLGNVEIKTFGGETGILVRTEAQDLPRPVYKKMITIIDEAKNKTLPSATFILADTSNTGSVTYSVANPDSVEVVIRALMASGFQADKASEDLNNNKVLVRVGNSDWIKYNLREKIKDNNFQILREERIGPKVGKELKVDALLALLLSFAVILVYLAFRYKAAFGASAVLAVFHDSFIMIGLYSLLYGIIPGLNLEVNLTVVAAFLTFVGYSMSDNVIVFDRIRENMKIHKSKSLEEIMNMSVNQTMSRTILTGGAALVTILVLIICGGEVLRTFSYTLFFGILIGTYSSIFVASALVLDYTRYTKKKI
ncbi:MAG: protein translocase subunit SecF, partial [Bacteroidota bacterium]|nr:protein translocase subunit SecF [Bacteroidota bacterium]